MELNAVGGMFTMLERHDLAFSRLGEDFQFCRHRLMDDQGVITHPFEWRRNIFENPLPTVIYGRCFAVHQALRPIHFAAVDGAEALVTEADAKDGDLSGKVSHCLGRNAPVLNRFPWTRRDDKMVRLEGD